MTPIRSLPVRLNGRRLTVWQLATAARAHAPSVRARVSLTAKARKAVEASRRAFVTHRGPIYGVTSGVGALDGASALEATRRAPLALLRSHAVGLGTPLDEDEVRAMIVVRAQQLAAGQSGVSLELLDAMLALLEHDITPVVPRLGSIGASDLAPLSYVGLVLAGEGRATFEGEVIAGGEALARIGREPHRFDRRDALGLINGPALTVARGALAIADAQRWLDTLEVAAALTLTALGTPTSTLDPRAVSAKGHRAASQAAARLAAMATLASRQDHGVQREPLSGRALVHVIGSARDALDSARRVVEEELSAAIDNPMIAADGWSTNNAGNGDTTRLGLALDHLADAMGAVAAQTERRIARLLQGERGLPPFLLHPDAIPGVDSGLMIAQYAAAAALADIAGRQGATAMRSLPVSLGTEDYNPMGPAAADRCAAVVARAADVVTIELLCAAQALDLVDRAGAPTRAIHLRIRDAIDVMVRDRHVGDDLAALRAWIEHGGLDQPVARRRARTRAGGTCPSAPGTIESRAGT